MSVRPDMQRLLFNLSALVDLGQEVTSTGEYADRMKTALYAVTGMFSIPRAALFVHEAGSGDLAFLTGKGLAHLDRSRMVLDEADLVRLPRNEPVSARMLRGTNLFTKNAELLSRMHATVLVPLHAKEEFIGMIVLGPRLTGSSLRKTERDVLKVAAHQIATAIHNARLFVQLADHAAENKRLYENMRQIYHDTIQAFATAIDAKDQYTKHHSFRVANYAAAIAQEMRWNDKDVEAIYVAGLLHDIGKLSLDVDLINKGDGLTPEEQEKIRRHSEVSYEIVARIRLPWRDVAWYIRHHHERPDGMGYPDSLAEQELSDGDKILSLADAYDAMTSDRPYRQRLSHTEAVQEIRRCEGTQFDGRIASVLFKLIERDASGQPGPARLFRHIESGTALPQRIHALWRSNA